MGLSKDPTKTKKTSKNTKFGVRFLFSYSDGWILEPTTSVPNQTYIIANQLVILLSYS